MKPYIEGHRGRVVMAKVGFVTLAGMEVLMMLLSASCRESPPKPDSAPDPKSKTTGASVPDLNTFSPPDLSLCTRVEIEFLDTALDYVSHEYLIVLKRKDILSTDEMTHLESIRTIVVDDKQVIEAFAKRVASGKHDPGGIIKMEVSAVIKCFRGDDELVSFDLRGPCIYIQRGPYPKLTGFEYSGAWVRAETLTGQLEPFELRGRCARNMLHMKRGFREYALVGKMYPKPSKWCDAFVPIWEKNHESRWFEFRCPSMPDAKCTYAMNPACEPNSPPDTVLLFETKAGWNLHGGSELFTFENHDPKGGCVLLNGGAVKFIRTEEELKQLRWDKRGHVLN